MKKIFNILVVAAVALGAVACQNEAEESVIPAQGESVSISVTIADQTRVALGEFEEGKGYKLSFEEGDQLCVAPNWGGTGTEADYWFTYTKTEGDTYIFTCTAEGVSAIVGTKQNIFYFGGAPAGNGSVCNTAKEDISGVGMNGGTETFGTEPISLSSLPVLKYSSEYPVTFTASKGTFSSEAGRWATSYTATKTGTDIYIPMYETGTYTLTASIKGQEVKSKEITFEKNKIYNLGTLEAVAEEQVDGDPAGVSISIDGDFSDWDSITKNVATVAEDATYDSIKTLKAYIDSDNLYLYMEFDMTNPTYHFGVLVDADNDQGTGGAYGSSKIPATGDVMLYNYCVGDGSSILNFVTWSDSFRTWTDGAWVAAGTPIESVVPVLNEDNLYAAELAISRANVNFTGKNAGVAVYSLAGWGYSGVMPTPSESGNTLVIPVHN